MRIAEQDNRVVSAGVEEVDVPLLVAEALEIDGERTNVPRPWAKTQQRLRDCEAETTSKAFGA